MREFKNPYFLSTGAPVTQACPYATPVDEYRAAFADRSQPFLHYYHLEDGGIKRRSFTRGGFWDLACLGAACLADRGLSKGDRLVHGFSDNSPYDLIFRLSAMLVGCVPVTINWQADDNDRLVYKAKLTGSKLFLYDSGFRKRFEEIKPNLSGIKYFHAEAIEKFDPSTAWAPPPLSYEDEKMIIFTAGTTGLPKGVSLSHRSYLANRMTFEEYFRLPLSEPLDLVLVNPLHHTNSSALSDWGMRRKGTAIHLIRRYSTAYWKILTEVAGNKRGLLVAPMVPRHIDFLESLIETSLLPVDQNDLMEALSQTDILIGSAPVGPTTIGRILKYSRRFPRVRFGSTETCLQVMATPTTLTEEEMKSAFEAGWTHGFRGEKQTGYYIGREHYPFTEVKIVKAIDPGKDGYMQPCKSGQPGYLITRGANLMSGYAGQDEATEKVFREGWYVGLRDIGFTLEGKDGCPDYYWISRDSALLIRGGANYACEQVAADLSRVLVEDFSLKPGQFKLAVIGLRIRSEHDDSCCVTIELGEEAACMEEELRATFIKKASGKVSKGSFPDYVRFAPIPLSFKGAVLIPRLRQEFEDYLKEQAKTL
ncbi:MAG: class I adenylate-forming enzyme family protein [Deltaproteobacteria bacterium]|nr:class I adenylate-forming enzyme family protein [Deltaproteobacteria bacterium]